MEQLAEALQQAKHLVVFTGAGVSTLSGLPDFRGKNGLYAKFDANKIFSLELSSGTFARLSSLF